MDECTVAKPPPKQGRYPILDEAPPHYGILDETSHAGILDEGRP